MADVNNLNLLFGFAYVVVDEKWAVDQFPNMSSLANQRTHFRKTSEHLDVRNQGVAEMRGALDIVFSNVADDFSEIV